MEEHAPSITIPNIDDLQTIEQFQAEAHRNAKEKGWWDKPVTFGDCTSNFHGEISESFEEFKNGHGISEIYHSSDGSPHFGVKPEGVPIELADCVIRIMDFCGQHGIDLAQVMRLKMAYNRMRSYRHGGKVV